MRNLFVVATLLLTPVGVFAQGTWVVGERTCADVAIKDAVAQGQNIECVMGETGAQGVCTISGKCRAFVENDSAPRTPSLLQVFAQRVSQRADNTFNRVGDMVTSFLQVGEGEYTSEVRPFGYESESAEDDSESTAPQRSLQSFVCASGVPSFLARFVPIYGLCNKSSMQEVQFSGVAQKRVLETTIELDTGGDGLFVVSDPKTVGLGERASLRWGAAGVKKGTCVLYGPGIKERGDWGSAYTPAVYETAVFILECQDVQGNIVRESTIVDIGL